MMRSGRDFSLAILSLLFITGAASAQGTAQMNGRVTDESGAVLPGVTVTAMQTDTAFTRTAVTDETGSWLMPNLPIGPYRLEVSLQGFRTYVQTGIVLQVSATPTINAALAVGNLEETVSVEAAAPLVDVRSAGISDVVEQERIVELPLQGRQVTDLIMLAGAAVNTGRVTRLGIAQRRRHLRRRRPRSGVAYTSTARSTTTLTTTPTCRFLSRRAAGIPRGDQWPVRRERDALVGVGQCGDQVRHQQPARQRLRVPP